MLKWSLVIPDTHRPFHSRKAYALMLKVARFITPSEIVILGDYGEFGAVSSHSRSPDLPQMLLEEVESVNQGLDELDSLFPKAKKVYLEGNHEFRLERYLADKAPALFGLTSCRDLFRMRLRPRWSYLAYGKNQAYRILGSNLYARHTPLASSVENGLRRASTSYCFGHTHRIVQAHSVGLDNQERLSFSPGWLGDARLKPFEYLAGPAQWSHGFALVAFCDSSKQFYHEVVHIKKDFTCMAAGRKFKV